MEFIKTLLCLLSGKHFKRYIRMTTYRNGKNAITHTCLECGAVRYFNAVRSSDGKNKPAQGEFMNIEIEIRDLGITALATVSIDGVKKLTLSFASIEDAEKWAESCKSVIERMEIECDCPKCREERESETAKTEPEPKPEEPKPSWLEFAHLYVNSNNGNIYEYEGRKTKHNMHSFRQIIDQRCDTTFDYWYYRPIAELEGLEVGESVYAIRNNGDVAEYLICENYNKIFWVVSHDVRFPIGIDGVPFYFGNGKQMFWRTKERAERFGK